MDGQLSHQAIPLCPPSSWVVTEKTNEKKANIRLVQVCKLSQYLLQEAWVGIAEWTHDTPGVSCPGQHLLSLESEPVEPEARIYKSAFIQVRLRSLAANFKSNTTAVLSF